uniref:Secreted protein n=1 Tax=Ascaris lumbricoides TaxID=6252 RepID=A0A0M3IFU6_ASCLU
MAFAVVLMTCLIQCVSAGFFYSESATCGTVHCPRANWARFYGCTQEGECDFLLQVIAKFEKKLRVDCSHGYSCSYRSLSSHCCAVCSVHYCDVFAADAVLIEDTEKK